MKIFEVTMHEDLWSNLQSISKGIFYRAEEKATGKGTGLAAMGDGVYLTWDKSSADYFLTQLTDGVVKKYKVKPGLKMADKISDEFGEIKIKMGFQPWEYSNDPMFGPMLKMALQDKGYDGAISDNPVEGIVIFDPSNIEEVK
jgi:hypothetical protein